MRGGLHTLVLAAAAAAAVVLHAMAAFAYPVPWPDEAHFLAPARSLASHLTLVAPQINAPQGIFWMPDGYATTIGTLYALAPDTVAVARLASLALTLGFAGMMYMVGVRLGGPRAAVACAVAVWLVAPRVVLMANIARMEPLVLALAGGALLAATAQRWITAFALAALTVLVHPGGLALALALVGAAVLLRADVSPKGKAELAVAALAALAWAGEAVWLGAHAGLVREHLAFQLARKEARNQLPNGTEIGVGLVAVAGVVGCLMARGRLGRQRAALLATLFALVGALIAIKVTGNEMWYGVLGYETSALLLALAALAILPRVGLALPRPAAAVLALAPVVLVAALTLTGSAYDMAISRGSPMAMSQGSPWDHDFMALLTRQLHAFDARQDGRVLVALDRSSGLGPFLIENHWRHLSFIDPTPVTPLWARPDYVLYSLGPPEPGRRGIVDRLPYGEPTLRVAEPGSTAEVLLFPADHLQLPIP